MDCIHLTKNEKTVLLSIKDFGEKPDCISTATWRQCVKSLDAKDFVHAAYLEGGEMADVRLSSSGKSCLADNPNLRNPINWDRVMAIATLIIAFISFFVGCKIISNHWLLKKT